MILAQGHSKLRLARQGNDPRSQSTSSSFSEAEDFGGGAQALGGKGEKSGPGVGKAGC